MLESTKILILIHILSTMWISGIIWLVQIVQYPLFEFVEPNSFRKFHKAHTQKITWVVGPIILAQCLSISGLLWLVNTDPNLILPSGVDLSTLSLWAVLSLSALLGTALFSVPCHHQLSQGWNTRVHIKLLYSNWIRTGIWTLHSLWILKTISGWMK
jgi:hypothetical protein